MNNQTNLPPKKRLPMWSVDNFRYSKMTLDQAIQAIKDYWTGGLLAVVGTLLFYSNRPQFGLILYDVAIMAVLVIFIYLKHRWAGVMFLVYFLISKVMFFFEFPELISPYAVIMSLLFSLFFFRGTLGIFKYNYLRRH